MADLQSVKDDIAFMRALAQEGRAAPLLGGSIMVAAGVVFGTASLVHYAVASGIIVATPWVYPIIWLAAGAVFTAALFVLKARYRGRVGAGSPGNRAMSGVWSGVGWAIAALFASLAVAAWRLDDAGVYGVFPSVILALYGAAWTLAARMSERRWMGVIALISFASAIGLAALIGDATMYLAYAACLALTAIVPGVLMMRQEPGEIV